MSILIGCDPEVFVKEEGVHICAHGLVDGTKQDPQPVAHGAVQVDGMALEFNTLPAKNEDEFSFFVSSVIEDLSNMVDGLELDFSPAVVFSEKVMSEAPEEAKELGCDPSYSGYTGLAIQRAEDAADKPLRTAAGHIHLGWGDDVDDDEGHVELCAFVARELDKTLGLYSLLHDKNVQRRVLYGHPGEFRAKSYGVEYRTLSNFWCISDEHTRMVYRIAYKTLDFLMGGGEIPETENIQDLFFSTDNDELIKSELKRNLSLIGMSNEDVANV